MPVDYDVIANAIVEAETDTAVKAVEEDLVILKQEGLNDLEAAKAILNGGLISGMGAYLTRSNPGINMIGCSPENSAVMVSSLRKGRLLQITSKETISDGTAGGIESGSITFDLCRELVPDLETVREKEIIEALRLFIDCHGMPIEGAAAVAVASLLKRRESIKGSCVVVVLCGGNIDPDNLKRAVS